MLDSCSCYINLSLSVPLYLSLFLFLSLFLYISLSLSIFYSFSHFLPLLYVMLWFLLTLNLSQCPSLFYSFCLSFSLSIPFTLWVALVLVNSLSLTPWLFLSLNLSMYLWLRPPITACIQSIHLKLSISWMRCILFTIPSTLHRILSLTFLKEFVLLTAVCFHLWWGSAYKDDICKNKWQTQTLDNKMKSYGWERSILCKNTVFFTQLLFSLKNAMYFVHNTFNPSLHFKAKFFKRIGSKQKVGKTKGLIAK